MISAKGHRSHDEGNAKTALEDRKLSTTDGFHQRVKSWSEASADRLRSERKAPADRGRSQPAISRPTLEAKAISRSCCYKISPLGEIPQWFFSPDRVFSKTKSPAPGKARGSRVW